MARVGARAKHKDKIKNPVRIERQTGKAQHPTNGVTMPSKRNKDKDSRHVRLYHWFLKSDAWRSLSPIERALYVEIVTRYNGSNNGRIGFGVRDAAKGLHISKAGAARAFAGLQVCGFIVATKRSAFNIKTKMATEWRLTEFCSDIDGAFATKDFMKWVPPEKQNTVPLVRPSVPLVRPHGPSGETVVAQMSRNSLTRRTVKAKNPASQSHQEDTCSIPGDKPSNGSTPRRAVAVELAPAPLLESPETEPIASVPVMALDAKPNGSKPHARSKTAEDQVRWRAFRELASRDMPDDPDLQHWHLMGCAAAVGFAGADLDDLNRQLTQYLAMKRDDRSMNGVRLY
jgi:hypothetical protein